MVREVETHPFPGLTAGAVSFLGDATPRTQVAAFYDLIIKIRAWAWAWALGNALDTAECRVN